MNKLLFGLAPAVALCLPLATLAQTVAPAAAALTASAPALRYHSVFADYQPWQDIKPGDWQQMNANVSPKDGKGGGHAGHGSTPSIAPAPAAVPAAPAAKGSAPAAHQGHHMHGGKQ